jgi:hypothetical protein
VKITATIYELAPTERLPEHRGFVWVVSRATGKAISGVAASRGEAEDGVADAWHRLEADWAQKRASRP